MARLDSHADSNLASGGLHPCSPTQLRAYHELLEQVLDSVEELLIALKLSSSPTSPSFTPVGDDDEYLYSFSADGLNEHEIVFLELNRFLYLKLSTHTAASYDTARSLRFRIRRMLFSSTLIWMF